MAEPDLSKLRIQRDEAPPPSGRRRWVWISGIVILALALLGAFLMRPRGITVQVATASSTGGGVATAAGITANGYVVARTKASVSAEVMGRLEYLGVQEGSRVRKGEIVARIQSADYRAALEAARARAQQLRIEADQAQRDLERAERLNKEGLIATTEVENARTRKASLVAQLEAANAQALQARASLDHTNVRAPFGGTVLRKDAEVGEMVAPSSAGGGLTRTAIVTMADLSTLEVEVDVNEAYIAQVRADQPARITLDAYPDTSFAGVVRQVVPTADRQKATVQVKVSILDHDARILPEMGAKVEFVRESGTTAATGPVRVLVPTAAVVQGSDGAKVWVVEDGKAAARTVDVGPSRGDQVEIRRGLSGGEQVVLDAPAEIREGARLRIKSGA